MAGIPEVLKAEKKISEFKQSVTLQFEQGLMKKESVTVTQDNFRTIFFERAEKKFVSVVPETLESLKLLSKALLKDPMPVVGAMWDEIKKDPKTMILNLTIIYPLGKSLVGEYKAYQLAGDSSISNEEKLKAMNEAADEFGSSIFALASATSGITATKYAKPALKALQEMAASAKLSRAALEVGELVNSSTRLGAMPRTAGGNLTNLLLGGEDVKTAGIIDITKAKDLNRLYGKPAIDAAIKTMDEATVRSLKVPGWRQGFEEKTLGSFQKLDDVLAKAVDLPDNIHKEILSKHNIDLNVKVGLVDTKTFKGETTLFLSRSAGASKYTGKTFAFTKEYQKLFEVKGDWKSVAENWAGKNGIKDIKGFIDYIEQERGRIDLKNVFSSKSIKDSDGIVKESNRSVIVKISKEQVPSHDPLHTLAPNGATAKQLGSKLSEELAEGYTVAKFSPYLDGIDKLAPQYYKHARGGTLKFFNDGTLQAYSGGDNYVSKTLDASMEAGKNLKGFKFSTRADGWGDELTSVFSGQRTKEEINQYANLIEMKLNSQLSKRALENGVQFKVLSEFTSAPQKTPFGQILKETGEKLSKLKEQL